MTWRDALADEDRQAARAGLRVVAAGNERALTPVRLRDQGLVTLQRGRIEVHVVDLRVTGRNVGFPRPVAVRQMAVDAGHDLIHAAVRFDRVGAAEEVEHSEQRPWVARCADRYAVDHLRAGREQRLKPGRQIALAVVRDRRRPDRDRGREAAGGRDVHVAVVRLDERLEVVRDVVVRAAECRPALERRRREALYGSQLPEVAVRNRADVAETIDQVLVPRRVHGRDRAVVAARARDHERRTVRVEIEVARPCNLARRVARRAGEDAVDDRLRRQAYGDARYRGIRRKCPDPQEAAARVAARVVPAVVEEVAVALHASRAYHSTPSITLPFSSAALRRAGPCHGTPRRRPAGSSSLGSPCRRLRNPSSG